VKWGEFKRIVDERFHELGLHPDEVVISFADWDSPRSIQVQRVDAGFAVVKGRQK